MFAPTAGLIRLIQLGEGGPIYLIPYEDHTLGAVVVGGVTTYIPLNMKLSRGHLITAKAIGKKGSELRKLGASELGREFANRGFSLKGKDLRVYFMTNAFKPKSDFHIPEPTIAGDFLPAIQLLGLANTSGDKLRRSFPISITDRVIAGFTEYLSVAIDHGGALASLGMFAPERLAKLPKEIVGLREDLGVLWIYSKKGEIRKVETIAGGSPIYNPANPPMEALSGELELKVVKAWFKNLTKMKGYHPLKLFIAENKLKLLGPGAGMLEICEAKGVRMPVQYFDARLVGAIVKAWSYGNLTIQASIAGSESPLCFTGGSATVTLSPILEYAKC